MALGDVGEGAAIFLYDAAAQAQSYAGTGGLRGEERGEDFLCVRFRDGPTVVFDAYDGVDFLCQCDFYGRGFGFDSVFQ